ncbi:hypothetical protein M758_7G028400 [Ceratodon purpureus]|uniref:Uncharacterized protein n=1 Tax=Ceratodon purpureus TaxID=3225 RepID=A0A8T0H5E7_CERPU|nr:hypothetical protein KC19_7G029900 [Ceratodon purpureus]KAG0609969.1 hypothetical protein M758_7G028400 [Ceratodon purpureus]
MEHGVLEWNWKAQKRRRHSSEVFDLLSPLRSSLMTSLPSHGAYSDQVTDL